MGTVNLSTNGGITLAGSYCLPTFSPKSPDFGGFDDNCQFGDAAVVVTEIRPPNHARSWTESALNGELGGLARGFALNHLGDLPGVVLAREGRTWGVYAPGTELNYDVSEDGNGAPGPKEAGQVLNWVLLPLAMLGGVRLAKRSRRRFLIIAVPIMVVAINAAVFYGSTRIRTAAEPSIALLAAIGAVVLVRLLHGTHTKTLPAEGLEVARPS